MSSPAPSSGSSRHASISDKRSVDNSDTERSTANPPPTEQTSERKRHSQEERDIFSGQMCTRSGGRGPAANSSPPNTSQANTSTNIQESQHNSQKGCSDGIEGQSSHPITWPTQILRFHDPFTDTIVTFPMSGVDDNSYFPPLTPPTTPPPTPPNSPILRPSREAEEPDGKLGSYEGESDHGGSDETSLKKWVQEVFWIGPGSDYPVVLGKGEKRKVNGDGNLAGGRKGDDTGDGVGGSVGISGEEAKSKEVDGESEAKKKGLG